MDGVFISERISIINYIYIKIMAKIIDIEYCDAWGFGGPALKLKKSLQNEYPDAEINCHSAK